MGQQKLMAKAAWLYHVEGLTQAEIGERMNLTRRRVNELLAAALEQGIVRISFSSPLVESVELESRLRDRFGLDDAVVMPARQIRAFSTRSSGAAPPPISIA